jgi:hypothetical protein
MPESSLIYAEAVSSLCCRLPNMPDQVNKPNRDLMSLNRLLKVPLTSWQPPREWDIRGVLMESVSRKCRALCLTLWLLDELLCHHQ